MELVLFFDGRPRRLGMVVMLGSDYRRVTIERIINKEHYDGGRLGRSEGEKIVGDVLE
jgi:hypothetical protein